MSDSPRPVKADQQLASYIAMVIRNAMEDFHCQHLTYDKIHGLGHCVCDLCRRFFLGIAASPGERKDRFRFHAALPIEMW